ncbi:nuclear transport factor 2 family protein [Burkholderia sp. BCCIQ04A]|uniref:Nuclear transport factor 2 family protein n=1 Tax=Burkholderia anthinoferrum TaxID=3090833 RepID=A0ABU5WWN1_9BURK|nr:MULTISPECIES: nuclear transport factor 2 family protein [Burkholderia]MEB2506974.1 nuclear transport factor 2 family protein [Burkholderia anthinoferrum]MEB2536002.1 nuclear transport factor 2 family protein [Burkholderia anthinoferrum]MEB2564938.1 nuclear transport factor 2 family protein [Burkholderia anthinoferrum]MEB2583406.1 nuclear transport factor 2 family protein [Burkholderia anthinoferrum]MCA8105284.1 nuclear transport factor 2 family protein [Burkholderia sp. AU36459]
MDAIRTVIEPAEAALRAAMLANDVEALDALLDDDLVFTVPTGQIISKTDDLAAHRARLLRLDTLDVLDMRACAIDEMILTTTRATLAGHFDSTAFSGKFAYTRLWRRSGANWRVVAGHASQVV